MQRKSKHQKTILTFKNHKKQELFPSQLPYLLHNQLIKIKEHDN
jgi:hypothetical protein